MQKWPLADLAAAVNPDPGGQLPCVQVLARSVRHVLTEAAHRLQCPPRGVATTDISFASSWPPKASQEPGVVKLTVLLDHGVGREPKQLRRVLQKDSKALLSDLLSQPLPGGARVASAQLVVVSTSSSRSGAPGEEEDSLAKHMRHLQSAEAGDWPSGYQDESFHNGAAFLDGSVHFGAMDASVHDGKARGSEEMEQPPLAPSTP